MKLIFWSSLAVIAYVYVGYPLLLAAWSRLARRCHALVVRMGAPRRRGNHEMHTVQPSDHDGLQTGDEHR